MTSLAPHDHKGFATVPSLFTQHVTIVTTWIIAIGGGLLTNFSRPSASGFASSAIRIPLSVLFWTVFYVMVCRGLKKVGGKSSTKIIQGYPLWSYHASFSHGWGVLLVLVYLVVANGEVSLTDNWSDGTQFIWYEQMHCAVIGYLMKDYTVYESGIDLGYIAHHLFACLGCSLCMHIPSCAGLLALNAVQCEAASSSFGLATILPNLITKSLYAVAMTLSNLTGAYVSVELTLTLLRNLFTLCCTSLWVIFFVRPIPLLCSGTWQCSCGTSRWD